MVWIKWGYSSGSRPGARSTYQLGDPLYWRACADGAVPKWVYFRDDAGGNLGDPTYQDLIVRDWGQYFLTDACPKCGHELGGAAVEIRGGVIKRAWLASTGEFDPSVYIYTLDENGRPQPRPDLDNHSMAALEIC
jgi:hypothetical protein